VRDAILYLAVELEEFEQEAGDDAGDADEEVDDNEEDVGGARFSEHERRRVHHRRYRPTASTSRSMNDNPVHSRQRCFYFQYILANSSGYRAGLGRRWPGFKSHNSLRQTVHTHRASVHQAAKLVADLLKVAGVTEGLAESNGSLPPGL